MNDDNEYDKAMDEALLSEFSAMLEEQLRCFLRVALPFWESRMPTGEAFRTAALQDTGAQLRNLVEKEAAMVLRKLKAELDGMSELS